VKFLRPAADSYLMEPQSWLLPDGTDRERMLDMDQRVQPVRRAAFGVLAVALVVCAPWVGWWTLLPLGAAAMIFRVADARIAGLARPEYAIFAAWAGSQVIIAASVAISGGPLVATMSWFAIPLVTLSARFSQRGIVVGVATTIVLILAVAFGVDAGAVFDDPTVIVAPISMVIAVAMLSTALMRSDIEHRTEAVIDQLTGMLNRRALASRTQELQEQSSITREPVGVIVCDIDCFKDVNDASGHPVGDAVLKDVAYLLRKHLRAFDLIYRLGGDEFLVFVPGAELGETEKLAEELREAIATNTVGDGLHLTMSLGVAASQRGECFEYERVFTRADGALYDAKSRGRNQVCSGAGPETQRELVQLA
jgi:diguanylate cyclase (GGDEF)-like protein